MLPCQVSTKDVYLTKRVIKPGPLRKKWKIESPKSKVKYNYEKGKVFKL
jgi:hypothetical protein